MSGLRNKGLIVAGLLASALPAAAADAPPYVQMPPVTVQEFGSGWYLRGDIGYRFNNSLHGTSSNGMLLAPERFEDAFVVGGGFGFKERWFRADLTVDYGTQSRYLGSSALGAPYFAVKIDSVTGLVNGYVDLGTWSRVTPYVGAGVGASVVRAIDFNTPIGNVAPNASLLNFAWAVMAGIGVTMTPNVVLDAGYRYLSIGDAKSGQPNFGPSLSTERISGHEVRLGARYMID